MREFTYAILLSKRIGVEASLKALAKKQARKGLVPLTWTWGKAFKRWEVLDIPSDAGLLGKSVEVSRVPLTLVGNTPKFGGWSFVAALLHVDGENVVRSLPDVDLPPAYRSRGPLCEHCNVRRIRHETFVLRHEDGRLLQVGMSCLRDFLGSDDALKLASDAECYAAARAIGEEGFAYGGGRASEVTLTDYLSYVAWSVRVQGWVSRRMIQEGSASGTTTAEKAWDFCTDKTARQKAKVEVSAEDVALAEQSECWAEVLTDEEIARTQGDYLHNVRVIGCTGLVNVKTRGTAASMVVAYQHALVKERQRAALGPMLDAYTGVEGKRETFRVWLEHVSGYQGDRGYVTVLRFRTPEGACVVWRASSTDLERQDIGKTFDVTGKVKHALYKGAKQTQLSRCHVKEVCA